MKTMNNEAVNPINIRTDTCNEKLIEVKTATQKEMFSVSCVKPTGHEGEHGFIFQMIAEDETKIAISITRENK